MLIPFSPKKALTRLEGLPLLHRFVPPSNRLPTREELEGFSAAQRLAMQCCHEVKKHIRPGWSERQVAALMDTYLRDYGVRSFFHRSFAWFGDRSRFRGFSNYFDFLPKPNIRLSESQVFILDTAPIVRGFVGDVGLTFSLTENVELSKALRFLDNLRHDIPRWFRECVEPSEIWTKVDLRFKDAGYVNCHQRYPFGVLGHRVHRIHFWKFPDLVGPFSWHSFWALLSRGLFPELLSHDYAGKIEGLWAIEPHLGTASWGAKFEEILVVQDGLAQWLSDISFSTPLISSGST